MFCEICGKEIDYDARICNECATLEYIEREENTSQKVKKFILRVGRFLVDFDTIIGMIIAILTFIFFLLAAFGLFIPDDIGYFDNLNQAPLCLALAFIIPIVILLVVVIWHYFIYLLIDIKDSLTEIKNSSRRN